MPLARTGGNSWYSHRDRKESPVWGHRAQNPCRQRRGANEERGLWPERVKCNVAGCHLEEHATWLVLVTANS